MRVVMVGVLGQHQPQLPTSEDQHPNPAPHVEPCRPTVPRRHSPAAPAPACAAPHRDADAAVRGADARLQPARGGEGAPPEERRAASRRPGGRPPVPGRRPRPAVCERPPCAHPRKTSPRRIGSNPERPDPGRAPSRIPRSATMRSACCARPHRGIPRKDANHEPGGGGGEHPPQHSGSRKVATASRPLGRPYSRPVS